jgi:sec-independent protein translocase protein TatA
VVHDGPVFEALTPWHLALVLLAFVLLIGYKKLPDASRSLGRSLRIFRSEVSAMRDDDHPAPPALPAPTADELDEQARAEEVRAAALRARLAAGPAA